MATEVLRSGGCYCFYCKRLDNSLFLLSPRVDPRVKGRVKAGLWQRLRRSKPHETDWKEPLSRRLPGI